MGHPSGLGWLGENKATAKANMGFFPLGFAQGQNDKRLGLGEENRQRQQQKQIPAG
jgi:hypothetical protein